MKVISGCIFVYINQFTGCSCCDTYGKQFNEFILFMLA
ncbi:hypothetical protein BV121_1737 [Haemophilus influenzae]|nr:hypothetical protein BV121_1737 [Haemophilus influenzae]AVJ01959.1 hypothetical protein BV122_1525 [Haemophilus influenzae]